MPVAQWTYSIAPPMGVPVCGISWLKRNRGAADRYDKLAVRYEATVHIAAIKEWLRSGFLDTS